jgi:ribose transport system substrate-binding protein
LRRFTLSAYRRHCNSLSQKYHLELDCRRTLNESNCFALSRICHWWCSSWICGTRQGHIGFSALTNPFFKVIADSMRAEAKGHGYDVLVVSAERDVKKQADQIDDFIVKGVSAIVLNPCDSQSIGPAIKRANEAGIPVFTNDIKYDGDKGTVICHVATDNYQGGKLAGKAMVDHLGEAGGKVAILHFPQVESCQLRVKGFKEVVDAHNSKKDSAKIQVVATLDGGGVRDEGFAAGKDVVEAHPDLAAIFAINDPSALGARAALEAAGKADQVTIIAFDVQYKRRDFLSV